MRKLIIYICGLLIMTIAAIGTMYYVDYILRPAVTFSLKEKDTPLMLEIAQSLDEEPQKTITLKDKKSVRLQPGEYTYIVSGDNIEKMTHQFSVTPDAENAIEVDSNLSREKLDSIVTKDDITESKAFLKRQLGNKLKGYTISDPILYHQGEIYGLYLYKGDIDNNTLLYRTIVTKTNNEWRLVRYPELVLSQKDYPDIPVSVINDINAQTLF